MITKEMHTAKNWENDLCVFRHTIARQTWYYDGRTRRLPHSHYKKHWQLKGKNAAAVSLSVLKALDTWHLGMSYRKVFYLKKGLNRKEFVKCKTSEGKDTLWKMTNWHRKRKSLLTIGVSFRGSRFGDSFLCYRIITNAFWKSWAVGSLLLWWWWLLLTWVTFILILILITSPRWSGSTKAVRVSKCRWSWWMPMWWSWRLVPSYCGEARDKGTRVVFETMLVETTTFVTVGMFVLMRCFVCVSCFDLRMRDRQS